jgi:hypothetical protein
MKDLGARRVEPLRQLNRYLSVALVEPHSMIRRVLHIVAELPCSLVSLQVSSGTTSLMSSHAYSIRNRCAPSPLFVRSPLAFR